jgi:hypothetical protein
MVEAVIEPVSNTVVEQSPIPETPSPEPVKTQEEELYEVLSKDPLVWATTFCPNHHKLDTPKFHLTIIDAAMKERFLAIGAPRESAKSTVINFDYVAHAIRFKRKRFIVIIANPFKKAATYLDAIKREFSENENLKNKFPEIKIVKDAEGDSIFRHNDGFETKVLCKGVEQIGTIRGQKFKFSRPDLIICDDIEDDEMVKNPDRRKELQDYYDEAVVPAGEAGKCQYIIIGTVLHDDCQLAKMLSPDKYQEFRKIRFQALNNYPDNPRSLWPGKWTVDVLLDMMKKKPTMFAKEYQNDPASGSNVRFEKKDFRYWRNENGRYILFGPENEVITTGLLSDCRAAIACDLAWKEKRSGGADSTVLLPGYLTPDSNILVDDYICKTGMRPDEFIEQIFLMVERLEKVTGSSIPVGFEKAMLENVTQWMMRKQMAYQNKYIVTKELVWDADKETRIEIRLQPRYSQHSIFHKQGMGDLEHQLVRFPSATHDDIIDSLQGLVQLLKHPKCVKMQEQSSTLFDQLRQHAIDAKKPKKEFFGFGNRNNLAKRRIPAKKTFF